MRQIAVIGVGFIGGCLASSIKKLKICERLVGIELSSENRHYILEKGLVDEVVEEVPEDTDLIVIALPNDQVAEWVCKLRDYKALVLDVASVKGEILKLVESELGELPENYVPCHPIAGSEKIGPRTSHPSLFENRPVVIIPHKNQRSGSQELVKEFWSDLNAMCVELSAIEHDAILAKTSHLPHVLAYSFMSMLNKEDLGLAGSGLEDFTRIAGANPDMWWAIFSLNETELNKAIDEFQQAFSKLREAILKKDEHAALEIMNSAYNKRKRV